jgi:indole-3-glycerol phosphate synthase/phosphoribosylanthranilate isomerase
MEALVEVHDAADVDACRPLAPRLTGVNCRDLATFAVDLLHPLHLRPRIDWDTRLLFESGVRGPADIRLARSGGYDGVLVGETAVRSPERIPDLLGAFDGPAAAGYWSRLCARMSPGRPLVKICGITRPEDAEAAARMGADALGFVFAASPRRAAPGLLRELHGLEALKVAVTVSDRSTGFSRIDPEVLRLVENGLVDAVQLHGEETPEECAALAFPWYKAVRLRAASDIAAMGAFTCPRVLVDAFSARAAGGTGQRVDPELAGEAGRRGPLWLAGGIGPGNVAEVVRKLSPELIDASSGLEDAPGRKDHGKLRRFFEELTADEPV